MSLHRIVEHLNKIKYLASGFVAGCIDLFLGNPFLKCGKEALGNSVVQAVAFTS